MTSGIRQLSFDLPPTVSLGAEDFFISQANRAAYEMVTRGEWPEEKLVLTGPQGAGKSHLARVWQTQTGGDVIAAEHLAAHLAAHRPEGSARIVVEDADRLPAGAEEPLFHLHNRLVAGGGRLLLTARMAPARWPIGLPDLASRMQAATLARIDDPDADLLRAVFVKHFADRQIMPAPRVIDYLAARVERSFEAIARIAARLDVMALSQKSAISMALARMALGDGLETDAPETDAPETGTSDTARQAELDKRPVPPQD